MGFLASAINVGQPACGRACGAQKAMRPLPRTGQRPQTKQTLPAWAKVSLTTLPLSTWPERLLVLTTMSLRQPQYCYLGAAQATPLWRGAPDRSRARAVFSMPTATGSTLLIITMRNGDDESMLIHELLSMTCIVNIHFTAAPTPAHNGPV